MKTDQLIELIESLSGPEKRYFKVQASLHKIKGGNLYVRLFDLIEQKKIYSDKEIVAQEKRIKQQQLPSIKKYLYDMLLETLDEYHAGKSLDVQLRKMGHQAKILYEKALHLQSIRVIRKAKELAYRHDKFDALIPLLHRERVLTFHFEDPEMDYRARSDRMEKVSAEMRDVICQLQLVDICNAYNQAIFGYHKQFGESSPGIIRVLDDLTNKIRTETKGEKLPFFAKVALYNAYDLYYDLKKDTRNALKYAEKALEALEEKPEKNLKFYTTILNNIMIKQLKLYRFEDAYTTLEKLKNTEQQYHPGKELLERHKAYLFQIRFSLELTVCKLQGEYSRGLHLVPEIRKGLEEFGDKIERIFRLDITFNIAVVCFGAGNYSEALKWLNRITNRMVIDARQDIYFFARVFSLILHFEMGNEDLLEYQARSTYRYLFRRDGLHPFEQTVLKFIRNRLPRVRGREELISAFRALKEELEATSKDRLENIKFEYFDVVSWLESKIEGKPFGEIVQEKHKTDAASRRIDKSTE